VCSHHISGCHEAHHVLIKSELIDWHTVHVHTELVHDGSWLTGLHGHELFVHAGTTRLVVHMRKMCLQGQRRLLLMIELGWLLLMVVIELGLRWMVELLMMMMLLLLLLLAIELLLLLLLMLLMLLLIMLLRRLLRLQEHVMRMHRMEGHRRNRCHRS